MSTCVIVAASECNISTLTALLETAQHDMLVAVDGGYKHIVDAGFVPDVCIGDFDSLGFVPQSSQVLQFPAKKDKSDLGLALDWSVKQGATDVIIFGCLGRRLDHTYAAIGEIAQCAAQQSVHSICAIGTDCRADVLHGPSELLLPIKEKGVVSVFSLDGVANGICIDGLAYALDNAALPPLSSWGLSNEFIGSDAKISVREGTLLVIREL